MKLLLADQNRDILLMYRTLFAGRGDDVTAAFDGTQVADRLMDERYDLMIVNADIPRVKAAQLIRMAKDRQTPSITLTGRAAPEENGAAAYVAFPFFPEELFDKIDAICGGQADGDGGE